MKSLLTKLAIVVVLVVGFKAAPITYGFNISELDRGNTLYTLYYKALVFTLDNVADSNDTVVLHIDSHGGNVLSSFDIINSLLTTDAHTISHIKSGAFSGGAVIAVACDEMIAERYSSILFHKARIGGFFQEIQVVEDLRVDAFFTDHVAPYLSEEQIALYEEGGDIEIDGPLFASIFNTVKAIEALQIENGDM